MVKKLRKMTLKRCQKCEYYYGQFRGDPICGYFRFTGKRKQSPIGFCGDEFEPRTEGKHRTSIILSVKGR